MDYNKKKYTYITMAVLLAAVTLYVTYSLIKDGHPTSKSQNEYLRKANELHNDSLYEQAVEPYMRALDFDKQQSLVNYNIATNSLEKNYKQLELKFNNENHKLDNSVASSLNDANDKLVAAAGTQGNAERYSDIYHNIGVAHHMRDSLSLAAEAYKEALRKNPDDEESRYNLAVILYQMEKEQQQQQQQQQQQEEGENNENNDKKENGKEEQQQKEQENDDKENKDQEQQQQQDKNENNSKEQEKQQKEQDEELEKIEQMLKALMRDEKEIREKLDEIEVPVGEKKTIEKNW